MPADLASFPLVFRLPFLSSFFFFTLFSFFSWETELPTTLFVFSFFPTPPLIASHLLGFF